MPIASITLIVVVLVALAPVSNVSLVGALSDRCETSPNTFLPETYSNSTLICRPVWNDLIIRYSQNEDNVLTVVLSMLYTSGWVAMGFSKDGMMVGSSAMVGWIGNTGRPHMKQFYLRGRSSSEVIADQGELPVAGDSNVVIQNGPNIYMAFQLKFLTRLAQQKLLFAFGTATPVNNRLTEHDNKISVSFDFTAGTSSSSSYPYELKRSHGLLNVVGWGALLPIGAMVARYARSHDPMWFYLHSAIQFIGFILGLAGVVAGVALYHKLHASASSHRALGIVILALGILQVLALFLRPGKDYKFRKYWNWYHGWVGRLVLLLAAINIFVGINVGRGGESWKIWYGINLGMLLLAAIFFEFMLWTGRAKKIENTGAF